MSAGLSIVVEVVVSGVSLDDQENAAPTSRHSSNKPWAAAENRKHFFWIRSMRSMPVRLGAQRQAGDSPPLAHVQDGGHVLVRPILIRADVDD